jgi:ubiquinone/menaquinone biosynthesis C-methylase UbiE
MSTKSAEYVFGGEQNELTRLLGQAEDLKPETSSLFDQIGIEEGWRVADVGCGPIGVLDMLSERVGPGGAVFGIEREPRFASMARAEIEKRGLKNVSIIEGDLHDTRLAPDSFDLVHERLVLINVPESNQHSVVGAMFRLARPGGFLAAESWDRASYICHPEHPAWQILNDAFREAVRVTNGDGTSGRTLPWLLRSAGVTDVKTKVHVRAVEVADPRRTHRLGLLDATKAKILATGRLSEAEFDVHRKALAKHLSDPETLLVDQLFIQAWGTKRR